MERSERQQQKHKPAPLFRDIQQHKLKTSGLEPNYGGCEVENLVGPFWAAVVTQRG